MFAVVVYSWLRNYGMVDRSQLLLSLTKRREDLALLVFYPLPETHHPQHWMTTDHRNIWKFRRRTCGLGKVERQILTTQ
jgi:hypothetical protein